MRATLSPKGERDGVVRRLLKNYGGQDTSASPVIIERSRDWLS